MPRIWPALVLLTAVVLIGVLADPEDSTWTQWTGTKAHDASERDSPEPDSDLPPTPLVPPHRSPEGRQAESGTSLEERVQTVLPQGALLRDLEPIPGTRKALVIYILDPDIDEEQPLDDYVLTCPGQVNGQAIRGAYHLALFENGRFVNDVRIPGDVIFGDIPGQTGIVYRQLEALIRGQHATARENVEDGTAQLAEVKLLRLRDLNGDGRPHEFNLRVYLAACGHVQVLIAGYSAKQGRAIVYPLLGDHKSPDYWHDNFYPDQDGTVHYRFACADHANDVEVLKTFEFDAQLEAYVLTSRSERECEAHRGRVRRAD